MRVNAVEEKSIQFSLLAISLYKRLVKDREYIMSKQLLRCATSIGANYQETKGAVSTKHFLNIISISYREAFEAKYWLMLLMSTGYLNKQEGEEAISRVIEILKLISSIILTMKRQTVKSRKWRRYPHRDFN